MQDVVNMIIAITIGVLAIIYGIHELKWVNNVMKKIKVDNTKPRKGWNTGHGRR